MPYILLAAVPQKDQLGNHGNGRAGNGKRSGREHSPPEAQEKSKKPKIVGK